MIEITLNELDLELELPEVIDPLSIVLDGSTGGLDLQGPEDFGTPELIVSEWGLLDLDLLGFPYYGKSAFELAQQQGYLGNLNEWLLSLRGQNGVDGAPGLDGSLTPEMEQFRTEIFSSVQNAAGSAAASAQSLYDAQTSASEAEVHAATSLTHRLQAEVYRDETGQSAAAASVFNQQAEAYANDAGEFSSAAVAASVTAETSRAQAVAARDIAVTSVTSAEAASTSAIDNASAAVAARNAADDSADAAFLSQSAASAYADNAQVEANAARISQIAATAARDDSQIIADAIIIDRDTVSGYVTDAEAFADAARDSEVSASASRGSAETAAAASLTHSQSAQAFSDAAGVYAGASDISRASAVTAAGNALSYRDQTVVVRDAAVAARNDAGTYAANALGHANTALLQAGYADDSRVQAGISATAAAASASGIDAEVGVIGSVLLDLQNQMAEARLRLFAAASGGQPAIFEMYSATGGTSFIRLLASQIFFGENTFFDDATDTLQTLPGDGSRLVSNGPFGVSGEMLMWLGPSSVAVGSMTRANAYFYLARNAPRIGGLDFPTGGTPPMASYATEGLAYGSSAAGGGYAATQTIGLYVNNAVGAVTFRWIRTADTAPNDITPNPTGNAVYFTGTAPAGGMARAIYQCVVTDSVGHTATVILDVQLSDPA